MENKKTVFNILFIWNFIWMILISVGVIIISYKALTDPTDLIVNTWFCNDLLNEYIKYVRDNVH